MDVHLITSWILWSCLSAIVSAQEETCYPPGGVAGIVVATIVVTVVVGGLATAVGWRLWTRKQGGLDSVTDRRGTEAPPAPKTSNTEFAFDNPYFRDPDGDHQDTEKGKIRSSLNKNSVRSSKLSDFSSKTKKTRSGKNPFTFGGGIGKKHRALDDSCLTVEPERTVVNLRGHDFTGLGFNICGNMRDGILVKDVLHRGPASESGLIKAGDKIISVTVSFTNIVYEDALTILSYASPYDVQLELERIPDKSRALPNTPSGSKRPLGSCSFNRSGQKLFHPLYRSQSIDDLTQIDLPPSLGLGPRRSQSVGVAAHKLAAHFKNSDSKLLLTDDKPSSNQMVLSTTGSLNEKMLANVMADGSPHWKKRFEDTLDGDDSQSAEQSSKKSKDSTPDSDKKSSDISASSSQNYMKKNMKYLDSPHGKGKLEAYKSPIVKDQDSKSNHLPEHSRRAKTMAEASSVLWHLDKSIQDGDASDMSSNHPPWNAEDGCVNSRFFHKSDENESDVSHDSLEISSRRKNNKKIKKHSSTAHLNDLVTDDSTDDAKHTQYDNAVPSNKHSYQQKFSKKSINHTEVASSKEQLAESGSNSEFSRNAERVYANNILNKSNIHNSSPHSNVHSDEVKTVTEVRDSKEVKNIDHTPPVVYANHREMQDKILPSRGAQKTVASDHYGKVNGRNAYGERQKLTSSENFSQNYGGNSRIIVNGETDDIKNRFTPNSKTNFSNQQCSSPPGYRKQNRDEGAKPDEMSRWMEQKNKSNQGQKISKKSASPAGMFTQINPFQQPSRQKNANFKVWAGREESSPNGNESQYTSSLSNSYGSNSPGQSTGRDSLLETPYGSRVGEVAKTVLISPYESSSARGGVQNNSQIFNYRQQH